MWFGTRLAAGVLRADAKGQLRGGQNCKSFTFKVPLRFLFKAPEGQLHWVEGCQGGSMPFHFFATFPVPNYRQHCELQPPRGGGAHPGQPEALVSG